MQFKQIIEKLFPAQKHCASCGDKLPEGIKGGVCGVCTCIALSRTRPSELRARL